jgi:ferredoxin
MKTEIFYFTGTGNSLVFAKKLSENIPGSDIVPIAGSIARDTISTDAEIVGIVFPMYFWGIPKIVAEFVGKLSMEKAVYFFYVMTSGDFSSPQYVSGRFDRILKKKNKKVNAGYRVAMPSNYIKMYEVDPPELINKKNRQIKFWIDKISKDVTGGKDDPLKDKFTPAAMLVNWLWKINVNKSDDKFHAEDGCNSCGICKDVCPVNNIVMTSEKPEWNNKCQECLACIHICPQRAIQSGKSTRNKGRYLHPEISVKDIIDQKK